MKDIEMNLKDYSVFQGKTRVVSCNLLGWPILWDILCLSCLWAILQLYRLYIIDVDADDLV